MLCIQKLGPFWIYTTISFFKNLLSSPCVCVGWLLGLLMKIQFQSWLTSTSKSHLSLQVWADLGDPCDQVYSSPFRLDKNPTQPNPLTTLLTVCHIKVNCFFLFFFNSLVGKVRFEFNIYLLILKKIPIEVYLLTASLHFNGLLIVYFAITISKI